MVGVIDSGIDFSHPDLVNNIWTNPNEIADNGIDDDNNGFVDDIHGWDFWSYYDDPSEFDNNPSDENGHGTHVSGIIGAEGNNALGISGVNWQVSIMPIRFLGPGNWGYLSAAVAAINYATMMRLDGVNLKVTNNSWAWSGFEYPPVADAIDAQEQAGILFVAASGNNSINNDFSYYSAYPASYPLPNIVSVASTDNRDNRSWFSNYGATSVDLAAPGSAILSTVPTFLNPSGYAYFWGTSMAAPQVTGVAALAWSLAPDASYQQIKDALLAGVDPLPSLDGITLSGGRLNALNTLRQFTIFVSSTTPTKDSTVFQVPTEYIVDFSTAYDPSSIQANDLQVNGISATSFKLLDEDSVAFSFSAKQKPVKNEGLQSISMAAGSIVAAEPTHLISLDTLPTSVTTRNCWRSAPPSRPQAKAPSRCLVPLILKLTFNEAVDPASIEPTDLQLSGIPFASVSNVVVASNNKSATFHDRGPKPGGNVFRSASPPEQLRTVMAMRTRASARLIVSILELSPFRCR